MPKHIASCSADSQMQHTLLVQMPDLGLGRLSMCRVYAVLKMWIPPPVGRVVLQNIGGLQGVRQLRWAQ